MKELLAIVVKANQFICAFLGHLTWVIDVAIVTNSASVIDFLQGASASAMEGFFMGWLKIQHSLRLSNESSQHVDRPFVTDVFFVFVGVSEGGFAPLARCFVPSRAEDHDSFFLLIRALPEATAICGWLLLGHAIEATLRSVVDQTRLAVSTLAFLKIVGRDEDIVVAVL